MHAWAQAVPQGPAAGPAHAVPHQEATLAPTYDLVSFVASVDQGRGIALRWATAAELPQSRFTVERSTDRVHWVQVLSTDGEGARQGYRNYEVTDLAPLPGVSYYRLRAQAQGKDLEISDEQAVDYRPGPVLHFENEREQGHFTVSASGRLTDVQVLNDRGQFIPMQLDYGEDGVVVNGTGLPPGTYFVQALLNGAPVLQSLTVTGSGIIGG